MAEILTVEDLFDELTVKIFDHCDLRSRFELESVCRRWRKLSRKSWRKVDRINFRELFHPGSFPRHKWLNKSLHWVLKRAGKKLKILDLEDPEPETNWVRVNERTLKVIGHYCPVLEEIYFVNLKMLNEHLHHLARYVRSQKLRVVDLNGSFNHHCPIYDGLSILYGTCPVLEEINISNSLNARVRDCQEPWCPTLKRVYIDHAMAITSYSLLSLTKHCPNLEQFSMCGRTSGMDSGLLCLFDQAPKLRELSLCHYPASSQLGMKIGALQLLTKLYLAGSSMVTDEAVCAIAYSCQSLQILDISGDGCRKEQTDGGSVLTDIGLQAIAQYLPHLKKLWLDYREFVSDCGLIDVILNGSLDLLSLINCQQLSDAFVAVLSQNCLKLRHLNTSAVPQITIQALVDLCENWFEAKPVYGEGRAYFLELHLDDNALLSKLPDFLTRFTNISFNELQFIGGPSGPRRTLRLCSET